VTEPDNPWVEVKAGLAVKSVASVPNCDHPIESLALRPPTLVTTEMLSARTAAAANRIRMIAAPKLHRLRLYIDAPPKFSLRAHEVLHAYRAGIRGEGAVVGKYCVHGNRRSPVEPREECQLLQVVIHAI